MKYQKFKNLVSLLLAPAALCVLGLCLILKPDLVPWLIAIFIGWGLVLLGVICGIGAIFGHDKTASKLFCTAAFLGMGGWLIRHPLMLATYGGIFIGVWLVIDGGQKVFRYGDRSWGIVSMVGGAVLCFLPMIASRLVFSVCGGVLLIAGVFMFIGRLRLRRLDSGNDDPNIIDVDAL